MLTFSNICKIIARSENFLLFWMSDFTKVSADTV